MSGNPSLFTSTAPRLYNSLAEIARVLGPEASLRQVMLFLATSAAADAGTDQETLNKRLDSSPSATSRHVRSLALESKLLEFFLDPADGRRRVIRVSPQGKTLLGRIHSLMYG